MISSCNEFIQTPGICNGIHSENCMKQIAYAQFFDFIEALDQDLKKIKPLYEEDPQHFKENITIDSLGSLLETFDSAIDLFSNILNSNSNSSKNESYIISSIFATMFTNYMNMTADLLSHDFPNNSIIPFVGIYANLHKVYIDILHSAQISDDNDDKNINILRFKSVWNDHYLHFSNLPNLINYFDFPSFSQRLDNVYQYTKNFSPDDNSQQQLFMLTNNLSALLKSMKEKLVLINEKVSKAQVQDLLYETSSFQEYIQSISQNQLNSLHMSTIYALVANLELTISILNITEYLERINQIISRDNFSIDIAAFATPDIQLITIKTIMQAMISELSCLIKFSQKTFSVSIKRAAQSFYQAIKNDNTELNEKYEKLIEVISPLVPQVDSEYDNVFMSTMSNIRSPEAIFESFRNTLKREPKTLEDHCLRLSSFIEFENAANLATNESNDIIKFKEYLITNIISVKIQEIIPILEEQISRVEGNLSKLSSQSKMTLILSYCRSIIIHLHHMEAQKKIPNRARLFIKIFTLFMEFIEMIINREIDLHQFNQLIQNIAFPTPDLIKRSIYDQGQMSNLRILIMKIQTCQLSITKTTNVLFDKFANKKESDESYFQFDQTNGQYIHDNKELLTNQIGLFDQCDQYIRQLFMLLENFKEFSSFLSIYTRFYNIIGQSLNATKIIQKSISKVSPVLAKNIPIFIRCIIKFLKAEPNHAPFLSINSPSLDLYATVLTFLKSFFLNENYDHSNLFLHVLDSIPIINFSRSLNEFFENLNRVEIILLSSKSYDNIISSIKDYREYTTLIIRSIIANEKLNVDELNCMADRFLAGLFYLSPKVFSKVEECFTFINWFLRHLETLNSFIKSLSLLNAEYCLSTATFNLSYSDIMLKNFVLTCSKLVKRVNKSDFITFEISNYLSGFLSSINFALPKRLFEKVNEYNIVSIFHSFLNLYTSSVSYYQNDISLFTLSSILPPLPPVTLLPQEGQPSQSPNQLSSNSSSSNLTINSNSIDGNQSALTAPSLQLSSLWFMNNFDFTQKAMPLLTNLISLVATADENSENMKILIKMNEIIKKADMLLHPNNQINTNNNNNENRDMMMILNINDNSNSPELADSNSQDEIFQRNLFLNKFSFVYKLKKLLGKIKFESQVSQCQFINQYSTFESLIDTEINILHLNRFLMLSNFLLYERISSNSTLLKYFKFTKVSNMNEKSNNSYRSIRNKVNMKSQNNDYDDYDESEKSEEGEELADYEEEVEEIESLRQNGREEQQKETGSNKSNDKEKSTIDVEDDGEYEEDRDDAESRKEEEDQEYGESESGSYGDYDDYSEFRMRSALSNSLRRSNINGLGNGNISGDNLENILYSNNNKNKNENFFHFNFARKVGFFNKSTVLSKVKKNANNEAIFDKNENDFDSDNTYYNGPLDSFPFFYKAFPGNNQNTASFFFNNDNEFNPNQPFQLQLQDVIENSELMMNEIRKLIESSNRWMRGTPIDVLVPIIPLSDVVSDVNRELHSTIDSIYQQIQTFDKENTDLIYEAKQLMERNAQRLGDIRSKQKELIMKKKEFARSKNVLSYTYSQAFQKYQKLKAENLKKRFEIQKLNSKLQLSMKLNNFENYENEESEIYDNDDDDNSNDDKNENNSYFEDSDYEDSTHSSISNSSVSSEQSKKIVHSNQGLVIEPFVPVSVVANLSSAPVDLDSANQALNEAIIKNERLKSLLQASNSILQSQRMQRRKSKQTSLNNNDNHNSNGNNNIIDGEDENKDVIDRYFGKIALIKSSTEKLDKPISSEVDVEKEGELLIKAISDFRKNSTESRQTYREASKELLRKLDKMISIYRIQKDRTNKVRSLIRAAKVTKEDYKTALSKLLENDKL
ncbi:hypothetical protein M9Y10_022829 [Tritrichomonas musculus]|uniref:Uncharacterized protein n=1 Tax=Tritrichomonas musculus TaxID=1915356 RepID=A0ABR2KTH6_9EUKA